MFLKCWLRMLRAFLTPPGRGSAAMLAAATLRDRCGCGRAQHSCHHIPARREAVEKQQLRIERDNSKLERKSSRWRAPRHCGQRQAGGQALRPATWGDAAGAAQSIGRLRPWATSLAHGGTSWTLLLMLENSKTLQLTPHQRVWRYEMCPCGGMDLRRPSRCLPRQAGWVPRLRVSRLAPAQAARRSRTAQRVLLSAVQLAAPQQQHVLKVFPRNQSTTR